MAVVWLRTAVVLVASSALAALQDVPSAPREVSVSCGSREATLRWQPPDSSTSPITAYYIQYNNSFTPLLWRNASPEISADETQQTVSLRPWMRYTFRVVARGAAGESPPSAVSAPCSTTPSEPLTNPGQVRGVGTEPHNILITWDTMPESEHSGPGFGYRVYWRLDSPGEQWSSADITDWRVGHLVIPDQPSFSPYRIKVTAINQLGEAPLPTEVAGHSGEGVPTQAPQNLRTIYLSSNEVVLSWDPVDTSTLQGYHNGYVVQVWPESGGELEATEVTTWANTTRAYVDIPPSTRMRARVLARNGRRAGPPSAALAFHSPEGVPGIVQSFEAYQLGSSALYLVWRRPYVSNGVLTGYKIYYQTVHGTQVGPRLEREPLVPIQQSRAKLAGLEPDTTYRLAIAATTRAGEGDRYTIEFRTGRDVREKPDPPVFYWYQEGVSASVRVVWLPDVAGKPGSHFFVRRRLKGEPEFVASEPELQEDFSVVSGLDPCRTYEVQVVAVDGDFSTESAVKEVALEPEAGCDLAHNEILD